MSDFNLLRVRHCHAIFPECIADNFYERAYLKLLGEDMVENEDSLSVGLLDDSLQQEVHVLVNLHIRHVNIPLNLLQA